MNLIQQYSDIASSHGFSFDYGTLLSPDQSAFPQLKKIIKNLPHYLKNSYVQKLINQIPQIDLSLADTYESQVELRLYLIYFMNAYLYQLKEDSVKSKCLPKKIAIPLYKVSKMLGIKLSFAVQIAKNWKFIGKSNIQDTESIKIENLQLVCLFTENVTESYFLLGSVIASLIFKDIIGYCFQINECIHYNRNDEINNYFDAILQRLAQLIRQVQKLNEKMDPDFFYHKLRPYLGGLNQVLFEGIQITQNQEDSRYNNPVTSSGGGAGNDPSFQLFEKMFGIEYKDQDELGKFWQNIQKQMQKGMPKCFVDLIKQFEKSEIRSCCKNNKLFGEYYNKIIERYAMFFKLHLGLVQKFIQRPNPLDQEETKSPLSLKSLLQLRRIKFDLKHKFFNKYFFNN